jgi:hypothetical protein
MPFFPVDDDFTFHRKAIAAGNAALGLWVRAGAFCMKQATDGILRRIELTGMGTPGQAKRLVEVDLWHAHGHDCEACEQPPKGGWIFHDWTHIGRLKTGESIKADRDAARERMRRHRAEHSTGVRANKDRTNDARSTTPSPYPNPSSGSVSQEPSGWLARALDGLTDDDVSRISEHLRCSHAHARTVARDVLTRSQTPVARPASYVIAAVDAEPHRYRPTVQPPTKATCCPKPGHASYPADHCGACRSEQLAGGA